MSRLPSAAQASVSGRSFRHEAFLYTGDEQFLAGATAFVRSALKSNEAVMVAVVEPRVRLLREALGRDAGLVEFLAMAEVGRNPARIIPAWQDWIGRAAGPRGWGERQGIRVLSEPVWPDRTPSELAECLLHEQLLTTAFAEVPGWWVLCPYDVGALPPSAIEGAAVTHPSLVVGDTRKRSPTYPSAVSGLPAVFGEHLEEPPGPVSELPFGVAALGGLRELVAQFAKPLVGERRAADAVLVVSELAANSIKYGGGAGILRLWHDATALVCEVRDRGVITDPMAGRRRPSIAGGGRAGLWIANQVCDLLQIRSAPGRGTVVRARIGSLRRA